MKVSGAGANIENEKKIKIAEMFFALPGLCKQSRKNNFSVFCES
jgi:hypothetical protein